MNSILQKLGCGLIGLIIGFGIGYWVFGYHPKSTTPDPSGYFKDQNFKTDTTHDKGDMDKEPYGTPIDRAQELKPKKEIIHDSFSPSLSDTTYDNSKIASSGDIKFSDPNKPLEVWVPRTKFDGYNHLIYAQLTHDSLSLTTQQGNNEAKTDIYLVNYSKYKYEILNNHLNVKELNTTISENITQSKNKFFQYDGTYIYLSDEFVNHNIGSGIETSIGVWRFKISGLAGLPIYNYKSGNSVLDNTDKNRAILSLRFGYRLF